MKENGRKAVAAKAARRQAFDVGAGLMTGRKRGDAPGLPPGGENGGGGVH